MIKGQTPLNPPETIRRLQRMWWRAVIYCSCFLLGAFLILKDDWHNRLGLQGIVQAAIIIAYVLILLRIGLPLNYHPRKKVLH